MNIKDWEIKLNWADELFLIVAMTIFGGKDIFNSQQHKDNLEEKLGNYFFGKRWEDAN